MPQANVIKIKRSTGSTAPATLNYGELAYTLGAGTYADGGGRLFVGDNTSPNGNPVVIGGKYFMDMLDHQQGTLTASSAILVDASKKINELLVDNITLDGNTISITNSNGNLELTANGTGYVNVTGTTALKVPVGTTAQQPTAASGMIRYNSDNASFEGYSTFWSSLGGVKSVDGQTFITAELTVGAGDDTLRFYTNSALRMLIDTNSIDIDSTIVNVNLAATTESTSTSSGSLITAGGIGVAKNVYIGGNTVVTGYVEVSSIKNTGTLTLPTSTDTLVGRATSDTLTNKTISFTNNTVTFTSSELKTACSDETGSGQLVFATSPTLVTPSLGAATATSINGLVITSTTGTLTIANGKTLTANNSVAFTGTDGSTLTFGTGGTVAYTQNNLSVFASTTSSQLAGIISDETGTGSLVFSNSPSLTTPAIGSGGFTIAGSSSGTTTIITSATATGTITIPGVATTDTVVLVAASQTLTNKTLTSPILTTPTLGVATATSINGLTITSTTGTLTIANSKTLTVSNSLTFTGTDASSVAFGGGGTVVYTSEKLSAFASTSSSELASVISDETGSGALVFANTPTLVTPVLGSATATSITATSGSLTIQAASGNNSVFIKPTGTGVVDVTNTSSGFSRISGVAYPVFANDAVNKEYADAIASSLNVHGSVNFATTDAVSYAYVSGGTTLTINTIASDVITFSANHSLVLGSQIKSNATSNGLVSGTTYFVISLPNLNQVTVSTSPGGSVHTLTNGSSLSISVTANQGVGAQLTGTPDTVEGESLQVGYRILVKNHTTSAYNGVYDVTTVGTGANGVWTRSTDFDNSPTGEIRAGDYMFVSGGTINGSNGFVQITATTIIVGTTAIVFSQFSGAGQITAGSGLTKTGNTLDVIGTTNRIVANADSIDIASTYVGQTSITTLGTIATGVWNGSTIDIARGGTNITTYTTGDLLYASATNTLSKLAIGAEGYFLNSSGTNVQWSNTIDGGTF